MGLISIKGAIIVVILAVIFTLLPDIPPKFEFDEHSFTPALPFEGALSINDKLNHGDRIFEGKISGPEGLAVRDGVLYTGLKTGEIVALKNGELITVADLLQPCRGEWDFEACGRPLGLSFDKAGNLFVADAYYGIYKVNVSSGEYSLVVPTSQAVEGVHPKLPNAVVVGSDGSIYWSDSSSNVLLHNIVISFLGDKSGRLIKTNPTTGKSEVLIKDLRFANGVFLAQDESYVAVAETAFSRILRYWLKGPNKGKSEVFVDGLPGSPDNIQPTSDGGFVVSLIQTQSRVIAETLAPYPLVRKFFARFIAVLDLGFQTLDEFYPSDFSKKAVSIIGHYDSVAILNFNPHAVAVFCDKNGKILHSLHSTDGHIPLISEIAEVNGFYYTGSPHNKFFGQIKK